jgi:hypothetical protein
MITSAVLAVARDPDRITWDDPAGWPGTEFSGQPCWRAEGTAGDITVTVALSADGEILGARHARRPGAACGHETAGKGARHREGTRT